MNSLLVSCTIICAPFRLRTFVSLLRCDEHYSFTSHNNTKRCGTGRFSHLFYSPGFSLVFIDVYLLHPQRPLFRPTGAPRRGPRGNSASTNPQDPGTGSTFWQGRLAGCYLVSIFKLFATHSSHSTPAAPNYIGPPGVSGTTAPTEGFIIRLGVTQKKGTRHLGRPTYTMTRNRGFFQGEERCFQRRRNCGMSFFVSGCFRSLIMHINA